MRPALLNFLSGFFPIALFGIRGLRVLVAAVLAVGLVLPVSADHGPVELRVAFADEIITSGLHVALIEAFSSVEPDTTIVVIPAGQETAARLAQTGSIDAAIFERASLVDLLEATGALEDRTEILRGYYVLLAPAADPVDVLNAASPAEVVNRIAQGNGALLLPARDTAMGERLTALASMELGVTDLNVSHVQVPATERLAMAANRGVYTVAHLGDWIEAGSSIRSRLRLARRTTIQSFYDFTVVNGALIPDAAREAALTFRDFLENDEAQKIIADHGLEEGLQQFTSATVLKTVLETSHEHHGGGWLSWLLLGIFAAVAIAYVPVRFYIRERARYASATRLVQAAEGARDGVWDWDVDHNRAYITRRAFKVLGLPVEQTGIASPMNLFVSAVHAHWRERVQEQLERALHRHRTGRFDIDFRVQNRKDKAVWVRMRGLVVCENEKVIRMSGSVMDVTREKRAEAELRHRVMHDELTGLPNRSFLHSRLERMLKESREQDQTFSLFMIDLNRFKEVNDSLGHGVGDELLKTVAGRLVSAVGTNDTVARLGGDEFAVLLPDSNAQKAFSVAQTIRDYLSARPVILFEHSLIIEASVGIAMFPEHGDSVDALMQRADIAMYTAKRNKINCTFYSAAANPNSLGRIEHESELRKAIANDQLELHYQPKIDLARNRVVGVEALIRWTHVEYGVVRPQLVADLAEKSGLIHTLSAWVIQTAAKQSAQWAAMGLNMRIAINMSVWNIQNPDIVDVVRQNLRACRVSPRSIEFEITESAMIVDPIRAHRTLNELSELGISFSVDDFGTGFSSLSYLKRLPVQTVKIDQSFVREMVHDLADRSIVRSTVDMAHNLGLTAVAEGVEDEQMLALLREMRCDQGQGFYFSRALPADEFVTWMTSSEWARKTERPDEDRRGRVVVPLARTGTTRS